jgi:uncharacterized protein
MAKKLSDFAVELTGFFILFLVLFTVFHGGYSGRQLNQLLTSIHFPTQLEDLSTIFLSMFIEGIPFILLSVILSSFIHIFINETSLFAKIPKTPLFGIPLASLFGLIFPICECGTVPVAKGFMDKGLPFPMGLAFLVAAPVINPITIVSTYVAFGNNYHVVIDRVFLAFVIAITLGFISYYLFPKPKLKKQNGFIMSDCGCHCDHGHHHEHQHHHHDKASMYSRISDALQHALLEFIDMGKYFIIGSLIAAAFQTFIGFSTMKEFASHHYLSILAMMLLAFGLSLCSSSDAFVAASFRNAFGFAPILAFLVFGPMMNLKNALMMYGYFRTSMVYFLFLGSSILVFFATLLWF